MEATLKEGKKSTRSYSVITQGRWDQSHYTLSYRTRSIWVIHLPKFYINLQPMAKRGMDTVWIKVPKNLFYSASQNGWNLQVCRWYYALVGRQKPLQWGKKNPEESHTIKQVAERRQIHSDVDRRDVLSGKNILSSSSYRSWISFLWTHRLKAAQRKKKAIKHCVSLERLRKTRYLNTLLYKKHPRPAFSSGLGGRWWHLLGSVKI